jgi:NAD+ synthase
MKIKIAVVQFNPKVGALEDNAARMLGLYSAAAVSGADLVVFPECALTGYPLEDLVLRHSFMDAVVVESKAFIDAVYATGLKASVIFGTPIHGVAINGDDRSGNGAILFDPTTGKWESVLKYELPNYGVFDEKRIFQRGEDPIHTIEWRGKKIGLMICEDAWFSTVTNRLYTDDAVFLISINGSPFESGKNVIRHNVVKERMNETGLPFLYVNMVGGQDELVFDGGSFLYDSNGLQEAPYFEDGLFFFDTEITEEKRSQSMSWGDPPPPAIMTFTDFPTIVPTGIGAIYQACVLGLRDYVTKQGFKSVLLGYSGGVDSGIVAAMACDALGHENVLLVRLPSNFSSDGSLTDAADGAKRLGAAMRTIYIEGIVNELRRSYTTATYGHDENAPGASQLDKHLEGVADENIQARARGTVLMAISNQEGHMLLTTGNKSEVSVGYSTLYGDMSGGFNPIKDCYKVTVWDLCRWRNALTAQQIRDFGFMGAATEVVPEAIIVKPPSAELRPDQQDSDSLPAYPILDAMLKAMIEDELSVNEIVDKLGLDIDLVKRIRRLVDNAEYKRRQAAPGVKITSKIHGRDRRYPIVNAWRN